MSTCKHQSMRKHCSLPRTWYSILASSSSSAWCFAALSLAAPPSARPNCTQAVANLCYMRRCVKLHPLKFFFTSPTFHWLHLHSSNKPSQRRLSLACEDLGEYACPNNGLLLLCCRWCLLHSLVAHFAHTAQSLPTPVVVAHVLPGRCKCLQTSSACKLQMI